MPDAALFIGSAAAGACCSTAVGISAGIVSRPHMARLRSLIRSAAELSSRQMRIASIKGLLGAELERAAWNESPERMVVLAVALSACAAVLAASAATFTSAASAFSLASVGGAAGLALPFLALRSAANRRRARLAGELVPVLELFALELGGGGSPASALGAVTTQVRSELASDLRRMLIASQVAGSASFDARLLDYAERFGLPALSALATILAASRDYGTGVGQGVRALATDLRRAQRRELIAHSRRALNHVLLPAAAGVLLPFLAILMFPAVSALQQNLR